MKPKTLGQRLKLLREEYGQTQGELAANIGLKGHVGIYKIESDKTEKPQAETLRNIAKLYGTTVEWLMEGKGDMLPNGKIEIKSVSSNDQSNPWRDALIQKLEGEAKKWYEEYLDTKAMLKLALQGKFNPDGGGHLAVIEDKRKTG
jgi:transcriptional regulator with XRE-family HTH domain